MNLGSRFKRFIALILDMILLAILLWGFDYITIALTSSLLLNIKISIALRFAGMILTYMLYFGLFEQSKYQATPGKMLWMLFIFDLRRVIL